LRRAFETYEDKEAWHGLQVRGMRSDFSWAASATAYVDLYRKAIDVHQL
jgi:starch synthase